jgi:hypothetical protein
MNAKMQRVIDLFAQMKSESLDLHTLFEAGGNDPAAREEVLGTIIKLVNQGYLEERGSDFYALTDKGREAIK